MHTPEIEYKLQRMRNRFNSKQTKDHIPEPAKPKYQRRLVTPATEKQVRYLRKLGVRFNSSISKDEARDLIATTLGNNFLKRPKKTRMAKNGRVWYTSVVGGQLIRHDTWLSCKNRTHGVNSRFKKFVCKYEESDWLKKIGYKEN